MTFRYQAPVVFKDAKFTGYAAFIHGVMGTYQAEARRLEVQIEATYDHFSDAPLALRSKADRAWRASENLEFALAIEVAGNDVSDLRGSLLKGFQPKGRHRLETILRRAVKEPHVIMGYHWANIVLAELVEMQGEGLVYREDNLWLLNTPARKAERKARRAYTVLMETRRRNARERQEAVLAELAERGIAHAGPLANYNAQNVTITVEDMEKLLAAATAN